METINPQRSVSTRASAWNVLLGIWLIISPFVLGHARSNAFLVNNIVLGIVIGVLALIRSSGSDPRAGTSWLNIILGIWLIISPFALGFSNLMGPMINNVVVGIVVALIALGSASGSREPLSDLPPR